MKYVTKAGQKLNALSKDCRGLTEVEYVVECLFLIPLQLLSISLNVF